MQSAHDTSADVSPGALVAAGDRVPGPRRWRAPVAMEGRCVRRVPWLVGPQSVHRPQGRVAPLRRGRAHGPCSLLAEIADVEATVRPARDDRIAQISSEELGRREGRAAIGRQRVAGPELRADANPCHEDPTIGRDREVRLRLRRRLRGLRDVGRSGGLRGRLSGVASRAPVSAGPASAGTVAGGASSVEQATKRRAGRLTASGSRERSIHCC